MPGSRRSSVPFLLAVALIFVLRTIALSKATDRVRIPAGASIQAAIDAHPEGTTFLLAAGTWSRERFTPKSNDRFLGDPHSDTILDGHHINQECVTPGPGEATGVVLQDLTIENYIDPAVPSGHYKAENWRTMVNTGDGWRVNRCTFRGSGGIGIYVHGAATISGGRTCYNSHGGIECGAPPLASGSIIRDMEIDHNNTRHDNIDNDAAGLKMLVADGLQVLRCYAHDNYATGIWFDGDVRHLRVEGCTSIHNAGNGIQYEISRGPALIRRCVVEGNGTAGYQAQIYISSSGNAEVSGNTVTVPSKGEINGIIFQSDNRPDNPGHLSNVNVHDNTVTFLSVCSGANGYWNTGGSVGGNNVFHGNRYISPNGGQDAHFCWGSFARRTLEGIQTSAGQEKGSTISKGKEER